MGFFKTCLDFIAHAAFTPFSSLGEFFSPQHPLFAPNTATHIPETYSAADFRHGYVPSINPKNDCRYPNLRRIGYKICQDQSKSCWLNGGRGTRVYDIDTDYEDVVPLGIQREYWVTIDKTPGLSPDGQPKTAGVTINGTYPGPLIEACWGDEIIVHVKNLYKDNGTTIHWHGIRQFRSNEMDGVNGVTQCPIAHGEEYVYRFRATQYGHTWYHSHYSLQYPDGVAGPLVIHGPTSAEWDIDLGPVMVADWIHDTAFSAFNCEAYDCGDDTPPKADNIVVNGKGAFRLPDGTFTNNYFNTTFTPKKKHLLRLINGSSSSNFVFSIDNHTLTVVASDLVAIKPYKTRSVMLGIGQRYTVVVEADQPASLYWIRTAPADDCNSFRKDATSPSGFLQVKETTAFVVYQGAPKSLTLPDDNISKKQPGLTASCKDESENRQGRLMPKVPWKVASKPSNNVTRDSVTAGLESKINPYLYPQNPFRHWVLAQDTQSQPLWVNFSNPTILDPFVDPPFSHIMRFHQSNGFVYLIIDGQFLFNASGSFIPIKTGHPIHLHGSDFVILNQEFNTTYDPVKSPQKFKLNNPARRDTAMLPYNGYLAIAFKPDNPGAWLMHCHIAWHASSGLALQLVVRPADIPDMNGDIRPVLKGCKSWAEWNGKDPIVQTDSGI